MKVKATAGDIACVVVCVLLWGLAVFSAFTGDLGTMFVAFVWGALVLHSAQVCRLQRAVEELQNKIGQQGVDSAG